MTTRWFYIIVEKALVAIILYIDNEDERNRPKKEDDK